MGGKSGFGRIGLLEVLDRGVDHGAQNILVDIGEFFDVNAGNRGFVFAKDC